MSDRIALSRRSLVRALAGVAALSSPLKAAARAFETHAVSLQTGDRDPARDEDWADVLGAFERGRVTPMNTANLGPACSPAREALVAYTESVDADPSFQNRAQFAETRRATRDKLARYLRADPAEIAVTRNTTEGNNFVVQGLDLGDRDEVVISAHNHPSNRVSWHHAAGRRGFTVREVDVPVPVGDAGELFADLQAACTPATRVLSFTHVTNLSGVRFPAAEICAWARGRGILTQIDGAQTAGVLDLDLHALGCDFFTASSHKWFLGPREAGLLYVRAEAAERLWPTIVGLGHERAEGAARYETLGQRDDAAVAAFGYAVEFFERIGSAAIDARVAALTGLLKDELGAMPGIELHTPRRWEHSGGVVSFRLEGVEPRAAHQWLYEQRGIAAAPSGVEGGGLRLSPHVYNSLADCRRAVVAVRELAAGAL